MQWISNSLLNNKVWIVKDKLVIERIIISYSYSIKTIYSIIKNIGISNNKIFFNSLV